MYVGTLLSSLDILRLYAQAWRMEVWEKGTLHVFPSLSHSLPNNCMLECLLDIVAVHAFVRSSSHTIIALLFASAVPL